MDENILEGWFNVLNEMNPDSIQNGNFTETIKDSAEVMKRIPELPKIMDKANQALTYLASGQIPQNSNSFSALNEKKIEMKSFKNQSIIGILLLVILGFIVF